MAVSVRGAVVVGRLEAEHLRGCRVPPDRRHAQQAPCRVINIYRDFGVVDVQVDVFRHPWVAGVHRIGVPRVIAVAVRILTHQRPQPPYTDGLSPIVH